MYNLVTLKCPPQKCDADKGLFTFLDLKQMMLITLNFESVKANTCTGTMYTWNVHDWDGENAMCVCLDTITLP